MRPVDLGLLEGRTARAVFLPTAAAEEGDASVQRWLDLGQAHFERLGVEAVPLRVLSRQDAERPDLAAAIEGAGLVYLSGGNPGYLAATLRGTVVWQAIVSAWLGGAAVAGCSAGACALSWVATDVRSERLGRAATAGGGDRGVEPTGLALVDSVAVIPHFDRIVSWVPGIIGRYLEHLPPTVAIVGLDEDTAVVSEEGGAPPFSVAGRQSAWVIGRDGTRNRFGTGTSISAADLSASLL